MRDSWWVHHATPSPTLQETILLQVQQPSRGTHSARAAELKPCSKRAGGTHSPHACTAAAALASCTTECSVQAGGSPATDERHTSATQPGAAHAPREAVISRRFVFGIALPAGRKPDYTAR